LKKTEADSILIINLEQKGKDISRIWCMDLYLIKKQPVSKKGQVDYCWQPWKQYPAGKALANKS
jgi:hypothetical protein